MPREQLPDLPSNSPYSIPRRDQHLLPPRLSPLQSPSPTRSDVLIFPYKASNCKYPGIEDITTNSGVNISQPFRIITRNIDKWKDSLSDRSVREAVDEIQPDNYIAVDPSMEEEARKVAQISNELVSFLSEVPVVRSSDEESPQLDQSLTSYHRHISFRGGLLSEYFIRHLPKFLNRENWEDGLKKLQATLILFSNAVKSFELKCMTDEERERVQLRYSSWLSFGKALQWAVDDFRTKLWRDYTELDIMKCIKTVFFLVLSFHYRESGYSMDISETSEQSDNPNAPTFEPRVEQINSDVIPFNQNLVVGDLISAANPSSFSQYQNGLDEGYSINQYEEFIAQEEQVFLERRLPVSTDGALVTMFHSHIVPMTPVVARNNGRYVRGTQRTELSIMDAAYAYDTLEGGCVIPCEFVLNRTYTPENNNATQGLRYLTYVGFVYPDNSMLSYIPIKHVRIVYEESPQRQPILRSGSTTFAFLHMDLPNPIYQNLKMLAKEVYLRKQPEMLFVDHFEEMQLDGRMVRIEVLVKSERTVRIEDQEKYLDYPVLQALFQCRHDLCGKALMHLRFTSTKRGSQRMQLRLILFGITVERNPYNYYDPIFDLLNAPPGPIQTPLPIPGVRF